MRLDESDSPKFRELFKEGPSITATCPLADFQNGVLVNLFLLVLLLAPAFPKQLAIALLVVWNLWLAWRCVTLRHWIVRCKTDRLFIKLFTNNQNTAGERAPNIIELEGREIESLAIKTVEIIWPRTKPTLVKFLTVNCASSVLSGLLGIFSPDCNANQERLVEHIDDHLFIQWKIYRPPVEKFLSRAKLLMPTVTISPTEPSVVDLRRFWCLSDDEQRRLFTRVKQLGFGSAGIIMLTQYKHMSRAESISYIACLGTDSLREPWD